MRGVRVTSRERRTGSKRGVPTTHVHDTADHEAITITPNRVPRSPANIENESLRGWLADCPAVLTDREQLAVLASISMAPPNASAHTNGRLHYCLCLQCDTKGFWTNSTQFVASCVCGSSISMRPSMPVSSSALNCSNLCPIRNTMRSMRLTPSCPIRFCGKRYFDMATSLHSAPRQTRHPRP